MNTTTPRLRKGGEIVSSSLFFTCSCSIFLFVTQLPSWSDGLYFLFGIFLLSPASCFSELVIFRNLLLDIDTYRSIFSQELEFPLAFFFFSVPCFGLACDH